MKYIIFLVLPFLFSAQTHRFIYEYQFKTDSLSTELRKENMILDLNPEETKFYAYEYAANDSLNKIRNFKNILWDEELPSLTRPKNSNRNTSYILTNTLFKVETEDPIKWNLSSDTKKVSGYNLQKATTTFGGRNWTAWFNTELNLNEGPYKFRGLPGLIFEISEDKGNFSFKLVKSYQLKSTYDTSDFLEAFDGKKALLISEKTLAKQQLDLYGNPLKDFKEMFKNSKGEGKFKVMNIEVKSMEQFNELTLKTQERMRRHNNPLELDKAIHYPTN